MQSVHFGGHVSPGSRCLLAETSLPSLSGQPQNTAVTTWQVHVQERRGVCARARVLCPCIRATWHTAHLNILPRSLEQTRGPPVFCHTRRSEWKALSRSTEATLAHEDSDLLPRCSELVSSYKVDEQGTSKLARPDFVLGQLLSKVSTWGIGGPAKYFIEVRDANQMTHVLRYCHQQRIPTFLLGKGSNVLFDDRGFNGCVILNRLDFIEPQEDGVFRIGAGVAFNNLAILTARLGYTGLEFATGIPGTVGGAVFMNAGAHGCDTGTVVESVEIVSVTGAKRTLSRNSGELDWAYRTSPFQSMEGLAAILAATFKLEPSENARKRQMAYMDSRRRTQPVTTKSAGCVFRNPGSDLCSAGALIEQLGLKGFSIGGAQVSEKHANFLINTGSATCEDMQALIDEVKRRAKEQMQVDLHEEIRYVAYDNER